MEDQIIETEFGSQIPDFTLWGMFSQADIVVQFVMVVLVAASIWSWAIIFHKFRLMRTIKKSSDVFEETFWSGNSLDDILGKVGRNPDNPLAKVFVAAMNEWQKSMSSKGSVLDRMSIQERLHKVMRVALNREMVAIERHTSYLASVGSVSPFVGLFGTVWGIMNAFQAIAQASNTSLAVVAPGIAEALLATALGLGAAIPAVIFYNRIINEINRFAVRLEGFTDEFSAFLSRQLDERT
ncbi:MAG: protein TolQ [Proteobacteria bacterium]|nr:protein TolQ [Pseudomonadota bacterium]